MKRKNLNERIFHKLLHESKEFQLNTKKKNNNKTENSQETSVIYWLAERLRIV